MTALLDCWWLRLDLDALTYTAVLTRHYEVQLLLDGTQILSAVDI